MKLVVNPRLPEFYNAFSSVAEDVAKEHGLPIEPDYHLNFQRFYYASKAERNELRSLIRRIPSFGHKDELESIINLYTKWQASTWGWIYPPMEGAQRILKAFPEKLLDGSDGRLFTPQNIERLICKLEEFVKDKVSFTNSVPWDSPYASRIANVRSYLETRDSFLLPVESASLADMSEQIEIWGNFGDPMIDEIWVERTDDETDSNPSDPSTNPSPS